MRKLIVGLLAVGYSAALGVIFAPNSARAENCAANPDALGTSRVLTIDPGEYPRVGSMDHATHRQHQPAKKYRLRATGQVPTPRPYL
jgi:hypothetical protein